MNQFPTKLYEAAAKRLPRGDSVRSVTRRLLRQDLGALQGIKERALRRYVTALAYQIEQQRRLQAGRRFWPRLHRRTRGVTAATSNPSPLFAVENRNSLWAKRRIHWYRVHFYG